MKAKLIAGILGCAVVLALFYQRGYLSKALLPGFYLSALVTSSGGGDFGKPYYVFGLALNAVIFSYVIFLLLFSPQPLHELRRLLTPARIFCLALFALFITYAGPVFAVLDTKWLVRNRPEMWIVPTPLPNLPIEHSRGLTLSHYGWEFDVPWTQLKREQETKTMAFLNFANGATVVFHDPSQEISELKVMKERANTRGTDIRNIFGDKATSSNYAFRSRILYLTPKDLSLFSSRREMVTNSVLLMLKPLHAGLDKGGMYSFRTEWLHGFQSGDPAGDRVTIIDGFDAQDHEVELWVGASEGSRKPSQADVNGILYSLRPVAMPSPH